MTYMITIGQNQWLRVECIGQSGSLYTLYQVTTAHRCPQVKQGDMIREDRKGMFVAYSSAYSTRPRYRFPSHSAIHYEDTSEEE